MTNRQQIQKMITELSQESGINYTLEGYDATLDYFSKSQLKRIKDALYYASSTDLRFRIKNVTIMVEVCFIDNEIDFYAMDLDEYKERYDI